MDNGGGDRPMNLERAWKSGAFERRKAKEAAIKSSEEVAKVKR